MPTKPNYRIRTTFSNHSELEVNAETQRIEIKHDSRQRDHKIMEVLHKHDGMAFGELVEKLNSRVRLGKYSLCDIITRVRKLRKCELITTNKDGKLVVTEKTWKFWTA